MVVSRAPNRSQFLVNLPTLGTDVTVKVRDLLQVTEAAPFIGNYEVVIRMAAFSLDGDAAVHAGTKMALVQASIGDATALFPLTPYGPFVDEVALTVNAALADSQLIRVKLLDSTGVNPGTSATVLFDIAIV